MKNLIFLALSSLVLAGEPLTLKLTYKEGEENDSAAISAQIQTAFAKVLESDASLAKHFKRFETPPPEGGRGRYAGDPIIAPIEISRQEQVDFRESGGTKEFKKTIALYYRFDEGMHRGIGTRSGFFALFDVSGNLTYRHLENDSFELSKADVVAKFQGFSRTLSTPTPDDEK